MNNEHRVGVRQTDRFDVGGGRAAGTGDVVVASGAPAAGWNQFRTVSGDTYPTIASPLVARMKTVTSRRWSTVQPTNRSKSCDTVDGLPGRDVRGRRQRAAAR